MADYREEEKAGHWLHIIIADAPASISDNRYNFISSLRDSLTASIGMMKLFSSFNGIIDCSVMPGNSDSGPARKLRFYIELDRVVFEYLSESDSRSPYYLSEKNSKADQKLFNINKWPVELWADECFDSGIHEEIRIASIDYNISDDNKTRDAGAKIFTGRMHGSEACFFMKDSRINSGSTGNAEGLKYVAASYLSIMKGIPLYVWNDGAGANIKEGVIALNRGAEGFMMNALQTGFTPGKFRSFIMHNPDPVLIALFESINMQFGFSTDSLPDTPRPLSLVAVGTGSSAGLDVYGSSQAVIQVMLDSEQSYRVLTGSGVIKSIIGEDISNYEIGGAKRICRDTGIADILSPDKFHLIETIREIHGFFYSGIEANFTAVRNDDRRTGETVNNPAIVLNDSIIRRNADHGKFLELKKYYRGADSLIGGFIKLCGQPVMIIGAKSRNGITGEASVIKAHELLKSAQRTCSHEIIVFGRELVRDGKDERLSSRIDFMNTLQSPKRLRIHIITDPDGLKLYYINNTADIIIFVDHNRISGDNDNFIKNNSAFRCSSINEAFTLSRGIIALISGQRENIENHGVPSIPGNPSTPFDMVTSVIEPVFDNETFIEFYSGMNNPDTGPMLITGIASLQGTAVGIIADHPLRKGGAADASGTEKFRIFTEFLNRQKIPLIMLSNSSGFMPGSQQENLRIQAIGAESLDANILGEIPVVSVTLHQNYGGRLIQAFNKFLRPGIVYLAFADSILAVIGTKVAFDILKGKEYARLIEEGKLEEAEKPKAEFYEEYLAKSRGASGGIESRLVDWIIPDIKDLREHLIKGFELAKERCREAFGE
jgi:acetyl-CoA carboxylase carboxyltransferase component